MAGLYENKNYKQCEMRVQEWRYALKVVSHDSYMSTQVQGYPSPRRTRAQRCEGARAPRPHTHLGQVALVRLHAI